MQKQIVHARNWFAISGGENGVKQIRICASDVPRETLEAALEYALCEAAAWTEEKQRAAERRAEAEEKVSRQERSLELARLLALQERAMEKASRLLASARREPVTTGASQCLEASESVTLIWDAGILSAIRFAPDFYSRASLEEINLALAQKLTSFENWRQEMQQAAGELHSIARRALALVPLN